MTPQAMQSPLHGIRVLDFTNMLAGPYCTRLLADLGAEVIKVEPAEGDHNRGRRPVRNGHSSFFGHVNCGKKSVVLNLKTTSGREAAVALASHSDVVVENWRPGVADRLGVGYSAVSANKSDIIYCSISGFGQAGPKALRPAYAPILHAASGFDLAQVEYQGRGAVPANTGTFIADVMGGLAGFGAIQTALFHRFRTGRGQFIDVALMDCMLNLLVFEFQEAQAPSNKKVRVYLPLKANDGFVVVAPTSQKNFEKLAKTVGHPEWMDDPRFSTSPVREDNWETFMSLVEEWTSQRSAMDCENTLLEAGVPCTRYRSIAEAIQDDQLAARGSLTKISDPAGEYLVPRAPFLMPGLSTAPRPQVAALGEDTASVLADILHYSAEQALACSGQKKEHDA